MQGIGIQINPDFVCPVFESPHCIFKNMQKNLMCQLSNLLSRSYIQNPGPMVVLSTPGMLHGGLSLTIFEEWCTNELNMIIMPGKSFFIKIQLGSKFSGDLNTELVWYLNGWKEVGCHLNAGQMDAILFSYVLVQYSNGWSST